MTVIFKNNAYSVLSAGVAAGDTTLVVKSGEGSLFPSPSAGQWFPVTLVKQDGTLEICHCTARTADSLTVTRGQEGTTAVSWSANERIELRLTKEALEEFVQQGTLDLYATIAGQYTFKTGMRMGYVGTTAPTGWVLGSGRTIGGGSSGATERANSDTEALFTLLWASYSNTELVIQDSAGTPTTRGASAAADFAANKRMPLPDYRGRVPAGKDDMGGTSANRLTSPINGDVMGASGGAETTVALTSGGAAAALVGLPPTIIETVIIKL